RTSPEFRPQKRRLASEIPTSASRANDTLPISPERSVSYSPPPVLSSRCIASATSLAFYGRDSCAYKSPQAADDSPPAHPLDRAVFPPVCKHHAAMALPSSSLAPQRRKIAGHRARAAIRNHPVARQRNPAVRTQSARTTSQP